MRLALGIALALLLTADPAAARPCGPPGPSLAQSAAARVYVAGAIVRGCHRNQPRSLRLGRRAAVLEARVAGRYAGVLKRDALVVHNLRRNSMSNRSDPYGPVTRWRIDRAGIAAYLAQFPNGEIHVGTSLEGVAARGAAIDPALLGLAAGVVGFRRGQLYEVAPYEMEPFHFATRRVLFSVGAVRIEARRSGEQTVLSTVRGTERISLGEAISPCISSSGCAGIDQLQITERFVATSHLSVDAHGSQSSVTVWPLDGSPPRHTTDPLPLPLP